MARFCQRLLEGRYSWLEQGIISMVETDDEAERTSDEAEKGEPAGAR